MTIDTARMRRNIDALNGVVFAEAAAMLLARHLGKARAQALLESLSRRAVTEQRPLLLLTQEAVGATATLGAKVSAEALSAAFDPELAAGQASASVAVQWGLLRERAAMLDARAATGPA
ncbi:MAG: hypothetical protein H7Y61_10650 [Rhizobiales bacterium]|nr:hypothetical protein [Rhizobacter sp.]